MEPSWFANITKPHRLCNDVFYLLRRFDKVRAGGSGSATLVRRMAVESGGSVLRAVNPGRPGMAMTCADEMMMRAVGVFVGREV